MLDFLFHTEKNDAINILKHDHDTVKALFDEFEKTEDTRRKKKIVADALTELRMHAVIEEEIFYPAVRSQIEKDIMNEANEEHHVAKLLIAELSDMDGTEEHYKAKFIVLSENIRHHIKEEEADMFPKVRSLDVDLIAIGEKMLSRKNQLKKKGIPKTAEDKLLTGKAKSSDSPAIIALSFEKPKKVAAKAPAKKDPAVKAPAKKDPVKKDSYKKVSSKAGSKKATVKKVAKKVAAKKQATKKPARKTA